MKRFIVNGILCTIIVAGSIIFLRESSYIIIDIVTHFADIILGRYPFPTIDASLTKHFLIWVVVCVFITILWHNTNSGNGNQDNDD